MTRSKSVWSTEKKKLSVGDDVPGSNSMDIVFETGSVLGNHFYRIRVDNRQKRKNLSRLKAKRDECRCLSTEEFLYLYDQIKVQSRLLEFRYYRFANCQKHTK